MGAAPWLKEATARESGEESATCAAVPAGATTARDALGAAAWGTVPARPIPGLEVTSRANVNTARTTAARIGQRMGSTFRADYLNEPAGEKVRASPGARRVRFGSPDPAETGGEVYAPRPKVTLPVKFPLAPVLGRYRTRG